MSDNPPAFPRESYGASNQSGMTLRDYFAGQALPCVSIEGAATPSEAFSMIASGAYKIADAMLAERSKP